MFYYLSDFIIRSSHITFSINISTLIILLWYILFFLLFKLTNSIIFSINLPKYLLKLWSYSFLIVYSLSTFKHILRITNILCSLLKFSNSPLVCCYLFISLPVEVLLIFFSSNFLGSTLDNILHILIR